MHEFVSIIERKWMKTALLIAEKPSLSHDIERVYKAHRDEIPYNIIFKEQRGHLVEECLPGELDKSLEEWKWETLPIVPENYGGFKYKVKKEKKVGNFLTPKERFMNIKEDLPKADFIIHAGDPDQEGELLVWLVIKGIQAKVPVMRFWTNDLSDVSIIHALLNLRDESTDVALQNLLAAGYARQHSDYRVGMNLSRACSLKMTGRVSVGRVKTPILKRVVVRENEIRNFKPHTVYGVKAEYTEGFEGTYFIASEDKKNSEDAENSDAEKEDEEKKGVVWFETKEEAEEVIASLNNFATVVSCDAKKTKTQPPKLFKLSSIQVVAGKYGYEANQTLDICQRLYEKKILSYPRTSCEYISVNENFIGIIKAVQASLPELDPFIKTISKTDIERVKKTKKWVNDKELEKEGHTALRPTTDIADMSKLTEDEKFIYRLVCRQFISIFLPPLIQNKVTLVTDINGKTFRSNGKTVVDLGYTKIFNQEFVDKEIHCYSQGDTLSVKKYNISEKTSTCPKRYTSASLIEMCENPAKFLEDEDLKKLGKELKIGTDATRAGIIKDLCDRDGYLTQVKEGKKVYLAPTQDGETIIENLGTMDIVKIDMTGYWEDLLTQVRHGELTLDDLEKTMIDGVASMVEAIKQAEMKPITNSQKKKFVLDEKCPKCGKDIGIFKKGYACYGFKDKSCDFNIWKSTLWTTISESDAEKLLHGETINKTQTDKFDRKRKVQLYFDKQDFKVKVVGKDKEDNTEKETPTPCDYECPVCGGKLVQTSTYVKCSDGNCWFFLSKKILHKTLSHAEISQILTTGKTAHKVERLYSTKKRKFFSAYLILNKEKKQVDFEF